MARQNVALLQFNRGLISPLALARTDLKRVQLSAETMSNWIARVLGSMMLRPGLGYLASSHSDAAANYLEFIFSIDDTALIEVTDSLIRVFISDAVVTRPSVSTAVTNGSFDTDLTGWTDADESGGTSAWVTGGYMGLTGDGTAAAIRTQTLTVSASDQNVEHALRIVIQRGPVTFRCGSTSGGDEYVTETTLRTGTHSLAFTPTGASVFIRFESRLKRQVLVDSCTIESAGVMTVTAPWLAADLDNIRFEQSRDVLFVACEGNKQRRIERRAARSWSVVLYQSDDGPFGLINSTPITLKPAALSGNTTLTASSAFFRTSHVGALFRLVSRGQSVSASLSAENTFSNTIEVTGVGTRRGFTISRTGTWVATITLQRSFDDGASWIDVTSYTTTGAVTFNDGLDNEIVLYRIGIKTGDYTSGTAVLALAITTGSITGVGRVTDYTSSTVVSCEVITDFGGTTATENWYEGEWSTYRGFPSSVSLAEGRLAWAGKDGVWLSVSDAFESFDDETVGDSGPISRTVGAGPVDNINWILALQRLLLGGEGTEFVCKSSSFDEPMTPTDFSIRPASTHGSSNVEAAKLDKTGIYIQRGGSRVMQIGIEEDSEYGSSDLTVLCPEVTAAGVKRMAIQRLPDTRVHCVLDDGTVAIATINQLENVLCWQTVETDGDVEDVAVLPGTDGALEDRVYYSVNRTINGSTKRYLEKWALESECVGGTLNKQADSFILYSGSATTTITGLSHLEGETVVVWGDGVSLGSYVVTGGQITGLSASVTSAVVGLSYTAQYKSTKLAYVTAMGTGLVQKKILRRLGLIMRYTHAQGLTYGRDFNNLDNLPGKEDEVAVSSSSIHTNYDEESFSFPGEWNTDSRLCLQATAPKPCTLLAAVISIEEHDSY